MNTLDTRIDRNAFSIASLSDVSDEKAYWLSKTPYERLKAIELMRRINYGYDAATGRLQSVFEVARLIPSRHKDLDDLEHLP